MPPSLALLLWLILLLALLVWDRAKHPKLSVALWVPVIWMFILASRLPSQWLDGQLGQAAQSLEEGNSTDRSVFTILILLALVILVSRSFSWGDFFSRNLALTAFVSFSLLSVTWSDYSFVAFKRWFRDLGNYLVILVVLSDPRPLEALRAVLRRTSYLLVPLSILLIKYYPNLGKQYTTWEGVQMFVGATTSKNMLGVVCLISGLFFFWDTVTRWQDRRERNTRSIVAVNAALLALTLWLLSLSNSATSKVCLALGCLIIAAVHSRAFQRRPNLLKVLIPACFCLYVILAFGFNINADLAQDLGRDPTLTDRTKIWALLLGMHTNPLVGTGYESFWLGSRLQRVWQDFRGLNEAHNGYLEVYLNLGAIGLILLCGFLMASYRTICRKLKYSPQVASLSLALWTILLFYNVSEAAFKGQYIWVTFLLGAVAVSERVAHRVNSFAASHNSGAGEKVSQLSLEATNGRPGVLGAEIDW